jgi:hypothetical protein
LQHTVHARIEHHDGGERAISGDHARESAHHRIHLGAWSALTLRRFHDLPDLVRERFHQRDEQLVPGAKVVVDRGLREPELVGDHL